MTINLETLAWDEAPIMYDGTGSSYGGEIATYEVGETTFELYRYIEMDDEHREGFLVVTVDDGPTFDAEDSPLRDLLSPDWRDDMDKWSAGVRELLYNDEEWEIPTGAYREKKELRETFYNVCGRYEIVWKPVTVSVDSSEFGERIVFGKNDCPVTIRRSPHSGFEYFTTYPRQLKGDWEVIEEAEQVYRTRDLKAGCYLVRRLD